MIHTLIKHSAFFSCGAVAQRGIWRPHSWGL